MKKSCNTEKYIYGDIPCHWMPDIIIRTATTSDIYFVMTYYTWVYNVNSIDTLIYWIWNKLLNGSLRYRMLIKRSLYCSREATICTLSHQKQFWWSLLISSVLIKQWKCETGKKRLRSLGCFSIAKAIIKRIKWLDLKSCCKLLQTSLKSQRTCACNVCKKLIID